MWTLGLCWQSHFHFSRNRRKYSTTNTCHIAILPSILETWKRSRYGCVIKNFAVTSHTGGSQIWIGPGCAAGSSGPIPMFRDYLKKNSYPCLGIFPKKKIPIKSHRCDFATNTFLIYANDIFENDTHKILLLKMGPMFRDLSKTRPKNAAHPRMS